MNIKLDKKLITYTKLKSVFLAFKELPDFTSSYKIARKVVKVYNTSNEYIPILPNNTQTIHSYNIRQNNINKPFIYINIYILHIRYEVKS